MLTGAHFTVTTPEGTFSRRVVDDRIAFADLPHKGETQILKAGSSAGHREVELHFVVNDVVRYWDEGQTIIYLKPYRGTTPTAEQLRRAKFTPDAGED